MSSEQRHSGWPRQAFRLSKEIVESTSKEEVKATIEGMKELGICRAPFDQMDILVQERELFKIYKTSVTSQREYERMQADLEHSSREIIFRYDNQQAHPKVVQCLMEGAPHQWVNMVDFLLECTAAEGAPRDYTKTVYEIGLELLDILIALLATRNVVKEVKECKTLRLGIGRKDRHQYTTTLKIGQLVEQVDGPDSASGLTRRPHLRRGHIRRQHHGPKNELVKSIWIEPVFVNADASWIAERTAYNVSLAARAPKTEQAA
jgi:hypothetical protein